MNDKVHLAWAVKVDHAQLGARLEAYKATKAAVTTLKACMVHSPIRAMSQLPPEVVDMISDDLKDIAYVPKIRAWLAIDRCLRHTCSPREHFQPRRLRHLLKTLRKYVRDEEDEYQYLWNESLPIHEKTLENHLREPANKDEAGCSKTLNNPIFTRDFGLVPYFTALRVYEYHQRDVIMPESTEVNAYLAMPIAAAKVKSEAGLNKATFSVDQVLDQETIVRMVTHDVNHQFKRAIRALRLDAPHIHVSTHRDEEEDEEEDTSKGEEEAMSEGEVENMSEGEEEGAETVSERDADGKTASGSQTDEPNTRHNDGISRDHDIVTDDPLSPELRCVNCGSHVCQGRFEAPKPTLMLLGTGELESYPVDEDEM